MRIRCPNCDHVLEIVPGSPAGLVWSGGSRPGGRDETPAVLVCPSCGSQVRPRPDDTLTYKPETRQAIGRFELLEHVGRGHFGDVWRARDTRLKRVVAVKVPRTADLSEGEKALFLREAQTAAGLRHPNIVTVHEVGDDGGAIFIVSDFISGITLAEQLKIRQPSFQEAARWCAEVADALEYAHGQGVVHRDMKPGNIMLEGADKLFVLDFGLAKTEGGDFTVTTEGEILGTPAYMSPEQARGDAGSADRRSDVYSLGVVLYEMLTGERPFKGGTRSLMHQVLHEEPKPPRRVNREVPRDLETICLKAMSKEPGRRYNTAGEFAADLRRYLAGEPIRARRVGLMERAWRWARRNPALSIAGGTAAAAALAAVFFAIQTPAGPAGPATQPVRLQVFERSTPEPTDQTLPEAGPCTAVFWRLDPETGEPRTDSSVRAEGKGNIAAQLVPGDYLVVVDVPGHGFHEVFRHVAAPDELPTLGYKQQFFTFEKDGTQTLPEVEVPPSSPWNGMSLVAAGSFQMGPDGTEHSQAREVFVPAFLMDQHEVTIAEYRKNRKTVPTAIRNLPEPEDRPVHHVNWFQATAYAESVGKRLPEEAEYEIAATNYGRQKYPWEAGAVLDTDWPLGAAGEPEDDRAAAAPEIRGLYSNVAEWTRSWANLPRVIGLTYPMVRVQRVVRGAPPGIIEGTRQPPDGPMGPRSRMFYTFSDEKPGLGFRCVRSAKPRLHKEDFGSVSAGR